MKAPVVLCCILAGCAFDSRPTPPLEQQYVRQPWARVPIQQAEAECHMDINRVGGAPNMYLCMRAKGYFGR